MNWRRWIVERLGGEWYEDDWHYIDDDDEPGYENGWRTAFRLTDLFRRRNAILSQIIESRVVDMDDVIASLEPDTSQFDSMLYNVSVKPRLDLKMEWLEDEFMPRLSALADDWGFEEWDDSPRKPLVTMRVNFPPGSVVYGTVVRVDMSGDLLRFIGGQTWERVA